MKKGLASFVLLLTLASYMPPCFSHDNRADSLEANTKLNGELLLAHQPKSASLASVNYLPLFQLSSQMALASELPAFGYFVSGVLLGSSSEQMERIYARRIIAGMANKQPFRDGANEEFVRFSMRPNGLFFLKHLSISRFASTAGPNYTSVWQFLCLEEKIVLKLNSSCVEIAFNVAVSHSSPFDPAWVNVKRTIAAQTIDDDFCRLDVHGGLRESSL